MNEMFGRLFAKTAPAIAIFAFVAAKLFANMRVTGSTMNPKCPNR